MLHINQIFFLSPSNFEGFPVPRMCQKYPSMCRVAEGDFPQSGFVKAPMILLWGNNHFRRSSKKLSY